MAQTIFWSWQSDQPPRETRNIIRDALIAALDRIAVDLEEADRPEIDHDTKDVPGSPDIVASILAKIETASVFVADVTPIALTDGGKHVANLASSFFSGDKGKFVFATQYAIQRWTTWIEGNARVAEALGGKGPWHLRLGVEGLVDTSWPNRFGHGGDVIALEERVECELTLSEISDNNVTEAVRTVFNTMLEAYGMTPMTEAQFIDYTAQ
ncbi:MAG: hypothetical protein WA910_07150 [Sphingopyxis granuli]